MIKISYFNTIITASLNITFSKWSSSVSRKSKSLPFSSHISLIYDGLHQIMFFIIFHYIYAIKHACLQILLLLLFMCVCHHMCLLSELFFICLYSTRRAWSHYFLFVHAQMHVYLSMCVLKAFAFPAFCKYSTVGVYQHLLYNDQGTLELCDMVYCLLVGIKKYNIDVYKLLVSSSADWFDAS